MRRQRAVELKNRNNRIARINKRNNKLKKNRNNSNIKIKLIFILLFVIVVAGIAGITTFSPPKGQGEVVIKIEQGLSLAGIAKVLEDENIIKSAEAFKFYSKLFSDSQEFKAGEYKIIKPIKINELTALLSKGSNIQEGIKITIPEGYVITQVATILENNGLGDRAGFLELAKNGNFEFEFLNFEKPDSMKYKLEGYIYPDTYYFFEDATNEDIINRFLEEFDEQVWSELKLAATEKKMDYKHLLTLASIVEKEAVVDKERARIASVFFNRLNINMSLQSCATIQYALDREKFAKVVTIEETKIESPYNTYKYPGLPPGPICNPGLASIKAVISPESTSYLFFVAKGDGTHQFSTTYEEHLAAIQQYQK